MKHGKLLKYLWKKNKYETWKSFKILVEIQIWNMEICQNICGNRNMKSVKIFTPIRQSPQGKYSSIRPFCNHSESLLAVSLFFHFQLICICICISICISICTCICICICIYMYICNCVCISRFVSVCMSVFPAVFDFCLEFTGAFS